VLQELESERIAAWREQPDLEGDAALADRDGVLGAVVFRDSDEVTVLLQRGGRGRQMRHGLGVELLAELELVVMGDLDDVELLVVVDELARARALEDHQIGAILRRHHEG